jgi:hypothetical protein
MSGAQSESVVQGPGWQVDVVVVVQGGGVTQAAPGGQAGSAGQPEMLEIWHVKPFEQSLSFVHALEARAVPDMATAPTTKTALTQGRVVRARRVRRRDIMGAFLQFWTGASLPGGPNITGRASSDAAFVPTVRDPFSHDFRRVIGVPTCAASRSARGVETTASWGGARIGSLAGGDLRQSPQLPVPACRPSAGNATRRDR